MIKIDPPVEGNYPEWSCRPGSCSGGVSKRGGVNGGARTWLYMAAHFRNTAHLGYTSLDQNKHVSNELCRHYKEIPLSLGDRSFQLHYKLLGPPRLCGHHWQKGHVAHGSLCQCPGCPWYTPSAQPSASAQRAAFLALGNVSSWCPSSHWCKMIIFIYFQVVLYAIYS